MSEEVNHEIASLGAPIPPDATNRVKVYRLKENDWDDLGTGLCGGFYDGEEACIHVIPELRSHTDDNSTGSSGDGESSSDSDNSGASSDLSTPSIEDEERNRLDTPLLQKRISTIRIEKKEETFIVMDEDNQVPVTLSFETAEGCDTIWEFLVRVRKQFSPDPTESGNSTPLFVHSVLPVPQLGNLDEIENIMRAASTSHHGRHELIDSVVSTDYLDKLVPLVAIAEEARSLSDLRHLCNIMKLIIFLNDSIILERVVRDEYIYGVMGALEYDPEFGDLKATHREYLKKHTTFKQVVPFAGDDIPQRIRSAHRLQYLKDVALARVLDGFTFSVVNTLIFFNQVGILEYLQKDGNYVRELFRILSSEVKDVDRQRDALRLIQQCCHLAKSQQAQSRTELFITFINDGLFKAIAFAMRSDDLDMRVAGTDILNALVDQEPALIQTRLFHFAGANTILLSDVVIERLVAETDLGVKSQLADIIKVIFNPDASLLTLESVPKPKTAAGPHRLTFRDAFLQIYARSAQKLFSPLKEMSKEDYKSIGKLEVALYIHLLDILCFFVRGHSVRTSYIILTEELSARVVNLLQCPSKHVKVAALRFFRTCISIPDAAFTEPLLMPGVFDSILDVVYETMPRNTLLNSACLEIFEHIRRDGNRPLISHLARNYRLRLEGITYVPIFHGILDKYELMVDSFAASKGILTVGAHNSTGGELLSQQPSRGRSRINSNTQQHINAQNRTRSAGPNSFPSLGTDSLIDGDDRNGNFGGRHDSDDDDDDTYFSCLDDDVPDAPPMLLESDLMEDPAPRSLMKPLVNYPDEEDDIEDDQDDGIEDELGKAISSEIPQDEDNSDGNSPRNDVRSESASPRSSNSPTLPTNEVVNPNTGLSFSHSHPHAPLSPPRSCDAIVPQKRRHADRDEDDEEGRPSNLDGQSKRRNSNGIGGVDGANAQVEYGFEHHEPKDATREVNGVLGLESDSDSEPGRELEHVGGTESKSMPRRLRRISISLSAGLKGSTGPKESSSGTSSSTSSPPSSPSPPVVRSEPISGDVE